MQSASKGSYWNGRKVLDAAKKAGGIAAAKGNSDAVRGDLYDTAYCAVVNNALNAAVCSTDTSREKDRTCLR